MGGSEYPACGLCSATRSPNRPRRSRRPRLGDRGGLQEGSKMNGKKQGTGISLVPPRKRPRTKDDDDEDDDLRQYTSYFGGQEARRLAAIPR
jgi:hypothetical protein